MNSRVREIPCETAADFIARLRITDDLWGGQQAWDWGFRGQGNAGWPLLPSAFRSGTKLSYQDSTVTAPVPVPTDAQSGWQELYEYKLIQHFLYLADRVGLGVPGDAQHFRLPPSTGNDRSLAPGDWPQPDVLETLAVAQHHGVPTRLLDITTMRWWLRSLPPTMHGTKRKSRTRLDSASGPWISRWCGRP